MNPNAINHSSPESSDLPWWVPDPLLEVRELQRELINSGLDVIDLSMINPDMQPPRYVLDRLMESVTKPSNHRYAVSRGVRKLREGFSAKYRSHFGVTLDPESEVCVSLGCKDALRQSLSVLIHPGDSVLIGKPTYPVHLSAVKLAGGIPVFFDTGADEESMLEQIDLHLASGQIKVVLLNFPNNPTGNVVSKKFFEQLVQIAHKRGVRLINDFVYGDMVFGQGVAPSLLSVAGFRGVALEIYSLSKAYNVPGWRVGALVGDAPLVRAISRLKSHADYGLFLPLQHAATAALSCQDNLVKPTVSEYERRAKLLTNSLTRLGWQVRAPKAGASVWAAIPEWLLEQIQPKAGANSVGSIDFVLDLLRRKNVLLSPGYLFGAEYDRYVRFALVTREERIREVIERLEELNVEAQSKGQKIAAA